jgi:uncharacterized membrane protein YheB (UPF0754 family)
MSIRWLALPLVGAVIGWFTNHLAVKMLFVPRKPWRMLGMTIQGLIPRRRTELAQSIADTVEKELFSLDDIRSALADAEYQQRLRQRIAARADTYLKTKARRSHWFVGLVLEGDAVGRLKDALLDGLMAALPSVAEDFATELESHIDIRRLVVEKVERFELDRIEQIVHRIARTELRHIEWVGGVLGFVIGLLQLLALYLLEACA